MDVAGDGWRAERLRITAASVLLVVGTFLAALVVRNLFQAAHRTIGWVVACTVVAALLSPVIGWLSRWLPRGVAIAATMVMLAVLVSTVAVGVFADLRRQVDRLTEELPVAAQEIESSSRFGQTARDFELADRVQSFVDALDRRLSERAAVTGAAGNAPTYFVNAILVVFFLIFGGRAIRGGFQQISDDQRRQRWLTVATQALHDSQRYILASLLLAVAVGLATGTVAWLLDLPAPAGLGLLMSALALVPYVGVLLGSVPALLLAAGFQPGWLPALCLGVVALQGISAAVFIHEIHPRTLRVGPAVIVIVALLGFEVYGLGGAFYGSALAVFAVALVDRAGERRREVNAGTGPTVSSPAEA